MAAAAVDAGYLAGFLGLEPPVIAQAIASPTTDLVISILSAIATKANEVDELYSEKLRVDIELENAVRSSENKYLASKATADKSLQDAEGLRQKLRDEESARLGAEAELQSIKAHAENHDVEVTSLKQRIESLQDSSRANLGVLEERNSRIEQLSQELTQRHQRNIDLNKEVSAATQKLRESESAINSARYKEESLKQQLELAARNAEWFEKEVKAKSDEAAKFRREKGARIAELTRLNEESKNELDSLRRSEQQLRDRLDAAQAKADDVLVKFQKQQEALARTEQSYKQEIKDQKRLVGMSQDYSRKHQERVRELEIEKERVKDDCDNEIRRIRLELEKATHACGSYEERIQQLETELDEARARAAEPMPGSLPQTPRPNGAASFLGRDSPFNTPGSIRKNGLTATAAMDHYYKAKAELEREKRRNEQLSQEMEQLILSLEAKAPEIQELEEEAKKLRADITRMSELSQESFEQRDMAKRAQRKAESELSTVRTELHLVRTQLRDLSMQIRMTVFNLHALEKGMEYLSPEEHERFVALAEGKTGDDLDDMSSTDQYITQRFIVYRNVSELQSKNEDLTRTIREISQKMQVQEELIKQQDAAKAQDTIEAMERELNNMVDEAKSMKTTMESYKAERDMFRRLFQQKASAGELSSALGSAYEDRQPLTSIETVIDEDGPTTTAALRQLQTLFDDFRNQHTDIRQSLQGTIDELKDEKIRLQADISRITSQDALTAQRYEMLQSNYNALQTEISHVKESRRSMSTNAANQESRLEALSEELVAARSQAESLQKEVANLRTEKELWQSIHARLSQDNDNLMQEKGRLNTLLATNQTLLNERDISESESRRTTQTRIDALESELSSTRERLSKEVEESKHLQQRKDYETKTLQERIDKTLEGIREKSERVASLTTTNDHLQARVNELSAELRNAEERFGRLLPRATPRAGLAGGESDASGAVIQELRDEIDDLKRELELARANLENTHEQLEHQKDLGRNTEEALESAIEARDTLEQQLQAAIAAKSTQVDELTERVSDISSELTNSNNELSRLRDSQGEVARKHEAEKGVLEDENRRLRGEAQRHAEVAKYHQQDLRTQAEIATKAQQDYETELVKHAEAAKHLQTLRVECNAVRSELAKTKAEAETAQLALNNSERSWEERQAGLTQEISELNARRDDLNAQNRILHEQLDSVNNQVAALQQNRSAAGLPPDAASMSNDSTIDGLRELNSYLRREKEILEVQLDIKTSEARRLQEQVNVMHSELDDVRLKLEQERRAHAESGKNSMSHKELMDKLHELNLYRESSATLRSELEQARNLVTQKQARIDELVAKVQPLHAEIEGLQTQKTYLEEEIKQVQEDRDRWQKRTEGILTKYGRIDPVEMDQLRQTLADLQAERDALKAAEGPLKAELETIALTLETERTNWANTREKLTAQFKERSRKLTGEKNEAVQRLQEMEQQMAAATTTTAAAAQESATAKEEAAYLQQQAAALQTQLGQLQAAQGVATTSGAAESSEVTAQLEQQLATLLQELQAVTSQKTAAESELQALRQQLETTQAERDQLSARAQELARAPPGFAPPETAAMASGGPVPDEERTQMQQTPAASEATLAELRARITELEGKLSEVESKLAESASKVHDFESNNARIIKERSEKMKVALNEKLKESRAKLEEEYKLKLEQERAIWKAEQPAPKVEDSGSAAPAQAPGDADTPAKVLARVSGQLSDADVREFLANNPTCKTIMASNLRKRIDEQVAKVKAEYEAKAKAEPTEDPAASAADIAEIEANLRADYEAKVVKAREAGEQLAMQRNKLKMNMAERKASASAAKLAVVEKAATDTPEKPVVEVWAVAKTAVAVVPLAALTAPATPAAGGQAPGTPAAPATPSAAATPAVRKQPSTIAPVQPSSPAGPPPASPAPAQAQATTNANPSTPQNPFSARSNGLPAKPFANTGQAVSNPFTSTTPATAEPQAQRAQRAQRAQQAQQQSPSQQQQQQQSQSQVPGPRTSAIPTRGGRGGGVAGPGRGRGGPRSNIPRGGGAAGGQGGGAVLNPGASEFQSGNKRPRGDSETGGGAGAKRAKGA